jgi:DNA mismatch repair ATPase MutS
MENTIEEAIERLAKMAKESADPDAALKLSQAALNLAYIIPTLQTTYGELNG